MATIQIDKSSLLKIVKSFLSSHGYEQAADKIPAPPYAGQQDPVIQISITRGHWAALENKVLGLSDSSEVLQTMLWPVRKQAFLESYHRGVSKAAHGEVETVDELVDHLRRAENVAPSSQAFQALAYVLSLPAVTDHPDLRDWSPWAGRQTAWQGVLKAASQFGLRERLFASPQEEAPAGDLLPQLIAEAAAARLAVRAAAESPGTPCDAALFDPCAQAGRGDLRTEGGADIGAPDHERLHSAGRDAHHRALLSLAAGVKVVVTAGDGAAPVRRRAPAPALSSSAGHAVAYHGPLPTEPDPLPLPDRRFRSSGSAAVATEPDSLPLPLTPSRRGSGRYRNASSIVLGTDTGAFGDAMASAEGSREQQFRAPGSREAPAALAPRLRGAPQAQREEGGLDGTPPPQQIQAPSGATVPHAVALTFSPPRPRRLVPRHSVGSGREEQYLDHHDDNHDAGGPALGDGDRAESDSGEEAPAPLSPGPSPVVSPAVSPRSPAAGSLPPPSAARRSSSLAWTIPAEGDAEGAYDSEYPPGERAPQPDEAEAGADHRDGAAAGAALSPASQAQAPLTSAEPSSPGLSGSHTARLGFGSPSEGVLSLSQLAWLDAEVVGALEHLSPEELPLQQQPPSPAQQQRLPAGPVQQPSPASPRPPSPGGCDSASSADVDDSGLIASVEFALASLEIDAVAAAAPHEALSAEPRSAASAPAAAAPLRENDDEEVEAPSQPVAVQEESGATQVPEARPVDENAASPVAEAARPPAPSVAPTAEAPLPSGDGPVSDPENAQARVFASAPAAEAPTQPVQAPAAARRALLISDVCAVGTHRDSQPIRAVAWCGRDSLAIGTNSRALRLLDPSESARASSGATLPALSERAGHHLGSLYAIAVFNVVGAPGSEIDGARLVATCSNDTTVKIVALPLRHGSDLSGAPVASISPGLNTLRDVAFLSQPSPVMESHSAGSRGVPLVACGGGGDFSVRVYALRTPAADGTSAPQPVLVATLLGHSATVHSLRPWATPGSGRFGVLSASADGSLRCWELVAAGPGSDSGAESYSGFRADLLASLDVGIGELHSMAVLPLAAQPTPAAGPPPFVAVGAADGTVAIVSLASLAGASAVLTTARMHEGEIRSLDARPAPASCKPGATSLLLSASFDATVAISVVHVHSDSAGLHGQHSVSVREAARARHGDKALCARWAPLDNSDIGHDSAGTEVAGPALRLAAVSDGEIAFASSGADRTATLWSAKFGFKNA